MYRARPAYIALIFATWLPACAQSPFQPAQPGDGSAIVDCRLPGVVRKFSSNTTYLLPGSVVKETVEGCKRRGGEYARNELDQATKVEEDDRIANPERLRADPAREG